MRGGERVLEAFCELFPDADGFTRVHKKGASSKAIELISSWSTAASSWSTARRWTTSSVERGSSGSRRSYMSLGGVSDRRWREGLLEVRRAQLENGVERAAANWNFLFQLGKGSVRRWLEKSGAPGLVALYRERLGRVRKSKAR